MFCIFSVEIMRDEIISELKHVWNDVEGQVDIKYEIKYDLRRL